MMKMIFDALFWLFANLLMWSMFISLVFFSIYIIYLILTPKNWRNFWLNNRA